MNRAWRLPALVLLPLLLVAGLVIESRNDDAAVSDLRLTELTATAASPGTPSSTWYCAAGSATGDAAGPAEQVVIVTNAADTASTGTITLYPDGAAPKAVPIEVAAHSTKAVAVNAEVKATWAATLVEITGGEVTVAHQLTGPTGRSISDCASSPSADWYFPAGTTAVGTDMWLAFFNPFPGEATVDVAFNSDSGARTPPDFQGIVVPGGSVLVKALGVDAAVLPGEANLSTTVSVRSGRIVTEQVQSMVGRDGGPKGLTATIGATAAAPLWAFPMGPPQGVAVKESVSVFNPGETDTNVLVQVQLDDPGLNGTVEPFEVSIPAHRVAVVDVSGDLRVPEGVPHWIIVRSSDGADIVPQRSLAGGGQGTPTPDGLAYSVGLPVIATRWLAAIGSASAVSASNLSIANPSATETATVTVRRHGGGQVGDVPDVVDLSVAPGERTVIDLDAAGFTPDSSVEVVSDVPVAVGQWMAFSSPLDFSTPLGVPVAGTQTKLLDAVGVAPVTDDGVDDSAPSTLPDATLPDESVPPDATGTSVSTEATAPPSSSTSASTTSTTGG